MSETISLEWIMLRELQAEPSIRDENMLIRNALDEAIALPMQRIGNFEAHVDVRLDEQRQEIETRLEQLAETIGHRRR